MLNNYSIKPPKLMPNWMKPAQRQLKPEFVPWCKNFLSPVPTSKFHYTHTALWDGATIIEGHVKDTNA